MTVSIDLDLRMALGPVRDQGDRPTCLAVAATTAHEFARGSAAPLSPEYLHFFASGTRSRDPVTFPATVRALHDPGQPAEVDCPYQPSDPPTNWVPPTGVRLFRHRSAVVPADSDDIAALLRAPKVPVVGLSLPPGIFQPVSPWVISPDGPVRGFHAVVVVGLGNLNGTRCFLIRNSWGLAWGMDGHAWLTDTFFARHLQHLMVLQTEVGS